MIIKYIIIISFLLRTCSAVTELVILMRRVSRCIYLALPNMLGVYVL